MRPQRVDLMDDEEDEDMDTDYNGINNTDSIAKGVFVFKRKSQTQPASSKSPTKKQRRKVKKTPEATSEKSDDSLAFFGLEKKGLDKFRPDRYQCYRRFQQTLGEIMGEQQRDIFGRVLNDVVKFVGTVVAQRSAIDAPTGLGAGSIPTCVLLTGVNLPDHNDMFCLLKKKLLAQVSPHVATIKSSASPNLKMLVLQTVKQLMKQDKGSGEVDSMDDENSDNDDDDESVEKRQRLQIGSMPKLQTWYTNQYLEPVSPRKSPKKKFGSNVGSERPPLVIVLEDFEAFSPQILQNFILNISMFGDLPFVLVFGVATTVESVHRSLPHSVTSLLAMQKLTAEPSIEILDKFIRAVVMSEEVPFKLGSKILQILFETFAFCDLSVKNILTAYQWCLLEHFSGRPTSVLCHADSARRQKIIENEFSDRDLDSFMTLPSFMKHVASNPEQFAVLLEDKKKFRQFLCEKIEILWQRTKTFNIFVGALHAMAVELPKDTLAQCFYSVYCSCMCEPVTQSHEYRKTFAFLQLSEKGDLIKRIKAFKDYLIDYSENNEDASKAVIEASKLLDDLENMNTGEASPQKPSKKSDVESPARSSPRKQPPPPSVAPAEDLKLKIKINRFQFQEKLLQEAKEKSKQEVVKNPFIELRQKVIQFWHKTFELHLGTGPTSCLPSKQVFNEIQYFDEVGLMREHLIGNPRDALQTALQDPKFYLENPELDLDNLSDISPTLPDVSIAYKLHLECQRFINLFDWFQCWLSIVTSKENPEAEESKKKKSNGRLSIVATANGDQTEEEEDAKLQARFSRAVSELQFLGYIRPSKRKTDHVERLALNN